MNVITPEQKKQARISLLREAIAQLNQDFEKVETDHGRTSIGHDLNEYEKELDKLLNQNRDVHIRDVVQTIFSGSERFVVYDIQTIRSERSGREKIEFQLHAFGREDLKTGWFYREQLIPVEKE